MAQVKTASDIAEAKYDTSKHTIVFVFDQSSCHRKVDKKALLVIADGTAKGLRSILAERGINTTRMKADDMSVVLSNHDDFINEKTSVEHYVEGRGHNSPFPPEIPLRIK